MLITENTTGREKTLLNYSNLYFEYSDTDND